MRLTLDNVYGAYSNKPVLQGVSMEVAQGECVGLIGRNGAGKSTLLRAVLQQLPRRSGAVHLGDTDLATLTTRQIVKHGVAYVPQGRGAFSELTVGENLRLVPTNATAAERRNAIEKQFPVLAERWNQLSGTLSGGECKMLNLARASLYQARLTLLDEPTANLSVSSTMAVSETINHWRNQGMTLLIVEHNLDFLLNVCDRVIGLERGTVQLNVRTDSLEGAGDHQLATFFGLGPQEYTTNTPQPKTEYQ